MIGFVNIIKPTGVSSGYVVNKIKKITKEKVGHLGTLDPLATGVLPIAIGKATRFFDYFLKKEKKYFALAKFGYETDTLDSEGKITSITKSDLDYKKIKDAAQSLVGKSLQMPPIYSAKSVNGVRAYEAAIKNQEIKLEPRAVDIYSIDVKPWLQDDVFAFYIHCSSGTYVRSIIRDVAEKVGSKATTVSIIRTLSGAFGLERAVTLEEFEQNIENCIIPVNDILKLDEIKINKEQAKDLFSGKEVEMILSEGEFLTTLDGQEFSIVNSFNNKIKNKIYLYEKDKIL